ncbi:MAG: DUF2617 family protein [Nitrospina sp.]|jgi:hypothetical protein|nr:DUF2617 family protein [Nitrospina sp.]
MSESIYFSLYQKIPDYCVRIFQSVDWTLANGVILEVSIIGKSHRVISRKGNDCLTEFITCFDHNLPQNSLESKCLKPGIIHHQEYRYGDLKYRVNVERTPQVFKAMEDFTSFLGDVIISDTLTHVFSGSSANSRMPLPFTGLALSAKTNTFYTVHTYPEISISIISSTNIELPGLSIVK